LGFLKQAERHRRKEKQSACFHESKRENKK
jgi:hypothetical protein